MKKTRLFFLGMLGAFLLNSCSSDDDTVEVPVEGTDYSNGFFVLNEGSQAAGTVTFVSGDLQNVEQEIFAAVNAGDDLGQYLQSMFFDENNAYIISNGSNLITVVDRYTFELVGRVESDLQVPYYGTVVNGKAYVTNLGSFDTNTDDFVAVINLETLEVEETIAINNTASYITQANGLLYVQNSSFGSGNSISVLNPATNTVENTIEVASGLNSIEIAGNSLYAISSGNLQVVDLSSGEVESQIVSAEGLAGAGNIDVEGQNIYYTIGNGVYTISIDATEPAAEPLFQYESNSEWGVMYGFEVEDDRIYVADAGDFASNSFVEVYSTGGDLLQKIEVGIAPNGFYFNN